MERSKTIVSSRAFGELIECFDGQDRRLLWCDSPRTVRPGHRPSKPARTVPPCCTRLSNLDLESPEKLSGNCDDPQPIIAEDSRPNSLPWVVFELVVRALENDRSEAALIPRSFGAVCKRLIGVIAHLPSPHSHRPPVEGSPLPARCLKREPGSYPRLAPRAGSLYDARHSVLLPSLAMHCDPLVAVVQFDLARVIANPCLKSRHRRTAAQET